MKTVNKAMVNMSSTHDTIRLSSPKNAKDFKDKQYNITRKRNVASKSEYSTRLILTLQVLSSLGPSQLPKSEPYPL